MSFNSFPIETSTWVHDNICVCPGSNALVYLLSAAIKMIINSIRVLKVNSLIGYNMLQYLCTTWLTSKNTVLFCNPGPWGAQVYSPVSDICNLKCTKLFHSEMKNISEKSHFVIVSLLDDDLVFFSFWRKIPPRCNKKSSGEPKMCLKLKKKFFIERFSLILMK